jgi:hypothetical protein
MRKDRNLEAIARHVTPVGKTIVPTGAPQKNTARPTHAKRRDATTRQRTEENFAPSFMFAEMQLA